MPASGRRRRNRRARRSRRERTRSALRRSGQRRRRCGTRRSRRRDRRRAGGRRAAARRRGDRRRTGSSLRGSTQTRVAWKPASMNSSRELGRVEPQSGKSRAARSGEPFFAVGADVFEEQVAEGDRLDPGRRPGPANALLERALVDLVATRGRDDDLDERDAERSRLAARAGTADTVHADPFVALSHRRQQRCRLQPPRRSVQRVSAESLPPLQERATFPARSSPIVSILVWKGGRKSPLPGLLKDTTRHVVFPTEDDGLVAHRWGYLPREVFFLRLGLVGVFFGVSAEGLCGLFAAMSGSFRSADDRTRVTVPPGSACSL